MCTKQKYDKKLATTALNHCKKEKGKKYRNECRIYECPECNSWHLTSKEEWEQSTQLTLNDLKQKQEWLKLMKKGEEN